MSLFTIDLSACVPISTPVLSPSGLVGGSTDSGAGVGVTNGRRKVIGIRYAEGFKEVVVCAVVDVDVDAVVVAVAVDMVIPTFSSPGISYGVVVFDETSSVVDHRKQQPERSRNTLMMITEDASELLTVLDRTLRQMNSCRYRSEGLGLIDLSMAECETSEGRVVMRYASTFGRAGFLSIRAELRI